MLEAFNGLKRMPKLIRTISVRMRDHQDARIGTIEAFLGACNQVSGSAVLLQEFKARKLHHDVYQEIREVWGLKAQMACSVFRTVCARYKHEDVRERCRRRETGVFFHRRSMPLQNGRAREVESVVTQDQTG